MPAAAEPRTLYRDRKASEQRDTAMNQGETLGICTSPTPLAWWGSPVNKPPQPDSAAALNGPGLPWPPFCASWIFSLIVTAKDASSFSELPGHLLTVWGKCGWGHLGHLPQGSANAAEQLHVSPEDGDGLHTAGEGVQTVHLPKSCLWLPHASRDLLWMWNLHPCRHELGSILLERIGKF